MVSLGEIAFWSLEGGDSLSCPEGNDLLGTLSVTHDMCWTLSQKAWHVLTCHPTHTVTVRHCLYCSPSHEGRCSWAVVGSEPAKPLNSAGVTQGSVASDLRQMETGFFLRCLISQVQPWASCMSVSDLTHLAAHGLNQVNQREDRCCQLKSRIKYYPLPLSLSPARCGCRSADGGHPPRCRAVQGWALACHQTPRAAHHQCQQVRLFLQQVRDRTPHPQVWHPPQSAQIKPNTWGTRPEDEQCIACYLFQNQFFIYYLSGATHTN